MTPLNRPGPPAAAQPPAWFSAALATPADEGDVTVHGARIRYRAWGERGTRGAVLVHGTAAHARWWDHIGPQLSAGLRAAAGGPGQSSAAAGGPGQFRAAAGGPGQFRTAALDLSGHGDSDWRDQYSLERWAEEVMAVAAHAGISGPPIIIGHSLGGTIAIRAASVYGASLGGIVVVDSPLYEALPEQRYMAIAFRGDRTYPSREEALARFRLVPEHPVLPYVRDHVAASSVTRRDDGEWGWKFDRSLFASMEPSWPLARPADCRIAVLRTEHGMMTQEMADLLGERLGQVATVVEIPAAGHHVLLDEPLSLVTALRMLLSGWAHPSVPASQSPGTARRAMVP